MNLKENYFFEGDNFLGVDKPAGLPTTYANQEDNSDCLIRRVKKKVSKVGRVNGFKKREGGLLYRLDNDTSGVVVLAKNQKAFDTFQTLQNQYRIGKIYFAVCEEKKTAKCSKSQVHLVKEVADLTGVAGDKVEMKDGEKVNLNSVNACDVCIPLFRSVPLDFFSLFEEIHIYQNSKDKTEGIQQLLLKDWKLVDCPIGHSAKSAKRMIAVKSDKYKTSGRPRQARTFYRVIAKKDFWDSNSVQKRCICIVKVLITKAMRHQIRVHLDLAGLPIIGDELYGVPAKIFNLGKRLYLHCGIVGLLN